MGLDFKEQLNAVKTGKIYEQFGLVGNPFTPMPQDIKESFIDREQEIEKFVRVVYDLVQGKTPHVPILGHHGIGKTHFLKFIFNLVKENKHELNLDEVYYIQGEKEFNDKLLINSRNSNFKKEKILLFIDDLDIITIHNTPRVNIFFEEFFGKIIGTWNRKAWANVNRKVDFKIPKAEPVVLPSFSDDQLKEIIIKRVKICAQNINYALSFFPLEVLNGMAFAAQGNPHRLITFCRLYLDYLFNEKILKVNSESVKKFVGEKLQLHSIEDSLKKLEELTPKQREILKKIIDFENLLDLKNLEDELNLVRSYLIEQLKGDPDIENLKSFIIFDITTGTVRFGWNHSIFKKDIDLVMGLFTAITTFSKETIDRQLKGLSVEGMEFKMIPFEKSNIESNIAILFILNRMPSPLLIKRIDLFKKELEKEFEELFITKNYLDFTDDVDVRKKIYDIMVQILKFDLKKLTAMNKNK